MTCNSQGRHTVVATSQVTYPAEGIFFSLFSVAMESIASAMLLVIINTVCLNRWLVFNFLLISHAAGAFLAHSFSSKAQS